MKVSSDVDPNSGYRANLIRRTIGVVVGSAVLATCLSSSGAVPVRSRSGAHVGLIVASNVYLREEPFDSVATFLEAMDRLSQPQPISGCCAGAWRVHFAALLAEPNGDDTLDVEFFAVASGDRPEPRSRVFSSAVTVHPGGTTVFINDFVITQEEGFAAGREYEVSLRPRGGIDREPLAKGTFMLR